MTPVRLPASLALLFAAIGAFAQAPARSVVPLPDAPAIARQCDVEIAAAHRALAALEKGGSPQRLLADINRLQLRLGNFTGPLDLLANVATQAATRDAAQACYEKFSPLTTEIFQSLPLLRRVQALKPRDAVDRSYRADLLDAFQDGGATLPPSARARAKSIADELEALNLAFQKAINEDTTRVTLTPAEAAGLPAAWLAARKRDAEGRLVLGMDYPTINPFLQNAESEDARRRVWLAFQGLGGAANLERLDRAVRLRHELAQLHGEPDYAHLALKRRMAATPQAVEAFLDSVKQAVAPGEQRELAELRAEKAALLGRPAADVMVERWDTAFLHERLKRARYAVDQEKLRDHFPTASAVQFAMRVAERLYGIEFFAAALPVWHPDVQVYDVHERGADGRRGAFLGNAYLDLSPREGKYNHAAAFPVAQASRLTGQKPTSVLVANFDPRGLNHEELETLLHEFGHVLHGVLSTARYADQAGTSVKRDFVEAPSQMFEEWARRPETLALFAEVCAACPRLSAQQLAQLDRARTFGRATRYASQWLYARYDMALHTGAPRPALATWAELQGATPLGYVKDTLFPAGFGHLLGGYAAGYYGYMWSEVLALDMLSAFQGRLMDPAAGRRYRDTILAPGGEQPPMAMVEKLLGRKPSAEAFFAEIAGRR